MASNGTSEQPPAPRDRAGRWAAPLAGVLAFGLGLAAAELVGILTGPGSTPVLAVGDTVVDLTPQWARDPLIALLGTYNKDFLFGVVVLVALAGAALAGQLEARRRGAGAVVAVLLAAVVSGAAVTRPDADPADLLPGVAAGLVALVALGPLVRRLTRAPGAPEDGPGPRRRAVLAGGTAATAVAAGLAGRAVGDRLHSGAAQSRADLALPAPSAPAPPVPVGATFDEVPGLASFQTPNGSFYRIDTALVTPSVDAGDWRLRITGLVERDVQYSLADILDRELVEAWATLCCVSNEVGGDLIGNALWLGVPTAELLTEAGPLPEADMVLSRSVDGWTAGTPVEALTDGRGSLLAVGMNGEPLPQQHGFPARLVVPGLYGYVSATKWVTELRLTTFADDEGYWTPRGWSALGPVKVQSRIDRPGDGASVSPDPAVVVAGVAWAQDVGVARVEVRVDGGEWAEAEIADAGTSSTWRQWRWQWEGATAGVHRLEVRATNEAGETQTEEVAPPAPDGATGYHGIDVRVG